MIKPYSELEPISRHTFRKSVHRSYLSLILFSAAVYFLLSVMNYAYGTTNIIYFASITTLVTFMFVFFFFDCVPYQQRFKAIYPDTEFKYSHFFGFLFFPILFFALTIFLYFKEPKKHITKSMRFRYVYLAFVPVFCLQLAYPTFAHWFGSPSTSYIVDVVHATNRILKYKNEVKSHQNVWGNYLRNNPGEHGSTEVVLLLTVGTQQIIKAKQGDKRTEKKHAVTFEYLEELTKLSHEALKFNENSRFGTIKPSLFHWLQPNGPIEVLLLTGIERSILIKFNRVLLEKNLEILAGVEKSLDRFPASERATYKKKIDQQKSLFLESETMKSLNSKRIDDSFPVK